MLNINFGRISIEQGTTQDWFERFSFINPKESFQEWEKGKFRYRKKGPIEQLKFLYRCILGAKNRTNINNYVAQEKQLWWDGDGNRRYYSKLGEEKSLTMELLMITLGILPPNNRKRKSPRTPLNRIVILTEFSKLPSLYYHKEVIKGILDKAKEERFIPFIQELRQDNLEQILINLTWGCFPHGIIFIRTAPNKSALKLLKHIQVPVVMVHSNQDFYPSPIIHNIIPIYDELNKNPQLIADILTYFEKKNITTDKKVVIAHMPIEEDKYRNRRVEFIRRVLSRKEIYPISFELNNYGFQNAFALWRKHPDAAAYICLSDQIALELKHIIMAIENNKNVSKNRVIIGFDDSPLASKNGLTSFGQYLTKRENNNTLSIGEEAVTCLIKSIKEKEIPSFENIEKKIYLAIRN